MRKILAKQLENLRLIILSNISTLKDLLDQGRNLQDIINCIEDSSEKTSSTKDQLQSLTVKIAKSIDELADEIKKLLNTYNSLINEMRG